MLVSVILSCDRNPLCYPNPGHCSGFTYHVVWRRLVSVESFHRNNDLASWLVLGHTARIVSCGFVEPAELRDLVVRVSQVDRGVDFRTQ